MGEGYVYYVVPIRIFPVGSRESLSVRKSRCNRVALPNVFPLPVLHSNPCLAMSSKSEACSPLLRTAVPLLGAAFWVLAYQTKSVCNDEPRVFELTENETHQVT